MKMIVELFIGVPISSGDDLISFIVNPTFIMTSLLTTNSFFTLLKKSIANQTLSAS